MSALIAKIGLHNELSLRPAAYNLESPLLELPLYLGLGIVAGLVAVMFKFFSRKVRVCSLCFFTFCLIFSSFFSFFCMCVCSIFLSIVFFFSIMSNNLSLRIGFLFLSFPTPVFSAFSSCDKSRSVVTSASVVLVKIAGFHMMGDASQSPLSPQSRPTCRLLCSVRYDVI